MTTTTAFSASTIANSARRVRQRRRQESEQQQQQQPLKQQSHVQMPQNPPLSPGGSSTGTNSSGASVRKLVEGFSQHLPTNREGARSVSPQTMIMSMSSVHGISSISPPVSPRDVQSPAVGNANSSGSSSSSIINSTVLPSHFRRTLPPSSALSPNSPSRSWDESDHNNRPPSPSIQRASSWTLQPKLKNFTTLTTHQPRQPRIVAELGSFTTPSTAPTKTSSFRRVNSSPMIVGPELLRSSGSRTSDDDSVSVEGTVSLGGSVGGGARRRRSQHNQHGGGGGVRPPTPTTLAWTSCSLEEEITLVPGALEEEQRQNPQPLSPPHRTNRSVSASVISPSSLSSMASTAAATAAGPSSTSQSLRQLCQAIQQNGPRPVHLSLEEKAIWDAIQAARRQARIEGMQQQAKEAQEQLDEQRQQQNQQSNLNLSSHHSAFDSTWETRLVEIQEQAVSQQRDNSRSLQAIQRVLADVQAERDQAVLRLQDYYRQPSPQNSAADSVSSSVSNTGTFYGDEKETMQRELKAMSERIIALEQELGRTGSVASDPEIKVVVEQYDGGIDSPVSALQQDFDIDSTARDGKVPLDQDTEMLTRELEWKNKEVEQLLQQIADMKVRRDTVDSADTAPSVQSLPLGDTSQLDSMRRELAEKTTALENAKMIIVSLENASGSLAADLRRKLKERDDDMAQIQKELADKQRALDTLATELRDLQKAQSTAAANVNSSHNSEAAQVRRLQLSSRLEANLAEIRAAAVILESTQDAAAVSNLSELLTDSSSALKEGIDVIENGIPEEQDTGSPLKLHKELEETKKSLQRVEEILRKQTAEAGRYKTTTEIAQRRRDEEVHALHAEIKILRQQCNTNMEVLTRKERELAVLRDSLRVEDDGVGYISDDEPDDDESPADDPSPTTSSTPPLASPYGPSQAEALATLLAHGGNHSFDSGTAAALKASNASEQHNKELESLKSELNKSRAEYEKVDRQLKVEKESLSNAKMIISSLERASKSMMEDLRARLQDSNTAIASLLEKSLESERISAKLRMELDSLKRENRSEFDDVLLALPPPPTPLLLTETID